MALWVPELLLVLSGGDFDSKRNRLMIFGGGHADYCGNEWLAFDLDELGWHLLSGPSDLVGYDDQSGKTPDGNPASRHTYNGLAYIASSDEFLVHGGSLVTGQVPQTTAGGWAIRKTAAGNFKVARNLEAGLFHGLR
ncbi:MAG: hypothetical protein R3E73_03890 [Porticoccaceae bacterium]